MQLESGLGAERLERTRLERENGVLEAKQEAFEATKEGLQAANHALETAKGELERAREELEATVSSNLPFRYEYQAWRQVIQRCIGLTTRLLECEVWGVRCGV